MEYKNREGRARTLANKLGFRLEKSRKRGWGYSLIESYTNTFKWGCYDWAGVSGALTLEDIEEILQDELKKYNQDRVEAINHKQLSNVKQLLAVQAANSY